MSEKVTGSLPSLLSAVLKASTTRYVKVLDSYSSFLASAEIAIQDCHKSRVSITSTSYRQVVKINKSNQDSNVSLLLLYNCYAQQFQPIMDKHQIHGNIHGNSSSNNSLFSKIEPQVELSFKGMECLCYDFNLIPKLFTRDQLIHVWRTMSMERRNEKKKPIIQLSFDLFLELLAKVAVMVFNKKKLLDNIYNRISTIPTSIDAINYLCHYMGLEDETEIRKKIEMFGNKIDASRPESKKLDKDIFDELSSPEISLMRNMKKTIFSSLSTTSLITGKYRKIARKPFIRDNSKFPILPTSINYVPSRIQKMIHEANKEIKELRESSSTATSTTTAESFPGTTDFPYLPLSYNLSYPSHPRHRVPITTTTMATRPLTTKPLTSSAKILEEEDDTHNYNHDDDDEDNNIIRVQKSFTNLEFQPYYVRVFDRYCIRKNSTEIFDYYESEGPFVDLGMVKAGLCYQIKLVITNESHDSMNLDVTTTDLESDDVIVSALPGPLVHGLQRCIRISLTITPGIRSVIGMVNVHTFTARDGTAQIISCPIYYQVVNGSERITKKTKCTIKKLSTLQRMDVRRYERLDQPPSKLFLAG